MDFFLHLMQCSATTTLLYYFIPQYYYPTMPLLPNTPSTTPPRQEKKLLDTTSAVTPRPCPTPTQIEDVNQTIHLQFGDLLDRISYMKLNSVVTSNFCYDSSSTSSISSLSLSVAASDRGIDDEEGLFVDDSVSHEESTEAKRRLKPSLKRCSKTFCFVPTIHDSPPQTAKRMRLNY